MEEVNIFWFRRDLRLYDNSGLSAATHSKNKVIPIFIFDTSITDKLPNNDRRINFIFDNLVEIDLKLKKKFNSSINVFQGNPTEIFKELIRDYKINSVFTNNDYEPYALSRDRSIQNLLEKNQIQFKSFKDQVIFEKNEVVKDDGNPYVVYTPYMRKWKANLIEDLSILAEKEVVNNFYNSSISGLMKLNEYGFIENDKKIELQFLDGSKSLTLKIGKHVLINNKHIEKMIDYNKELLSAY